jgi:hypothetical protein
LIVKASLFLVIGDGEAINAGNFDNMHRLFAHSKRKLKSDCFLVELMECFDTGRAKEANGIGSASTATTKVADAAFQAHYANQHVPFLLFAHPVLTHSINPACCGNGMHFRSLLHHHQAKNKFAPPPPIKKSSFFGNQRMLAKLLL